MVMGKKCHPQTLTDSRTGPFRKSNCDSSCTLRKALPYPRIQHILEEIWRSRRCSVDQDQQVLVQSPENTTKPKTRGSTWLWPMGLMATGMAGAAVLLRGCWHRRMSWPVRSGGYSYQVCLGC